MWYEIITENDLMQLMNRTFSFHDSCIKEMSYVSGAYVSDDLSMFPINNCRILRVVIQRQCENDSMIELEFHGLKRLNLYPVDENYTCEILDSTMLMKDGNIYWCDCGGLSETDIDDYIGTLIRASKLRWRSINDCMGEKSFYQSEV